MARTNDGTTTNWFEFGNNIFTADGWSVSVWFYITNTSANSLLWSMSLSGSNNDRYHITANVSDNTLRFLVDRTGAGVNVSSSNTWSANTWHHAAVRENGNTDHSVFLDGTEVNSSTSQNPRYSQMNVTRWGAGSFSASNPLRGRLAWGAHYDAGLSLGAIQSLAAGAYPPSVNPNDLLDFYDFLRGDASGNEPSHGRGGNLMTENGTMGVDMNPAIEEPMFPMLLTPDAAPPAVITAQAPIWFQ
jgi:hypothetical protein